MPSENPLTSPDQEYEPYSPDSAENIAPHEDGYPGQYGAPHGDTEERYN